MDEVSQGSFYEGNRKLLFFSLLVSSHISKSLLLRSRRDCYLSRANFRQNFEAAEAVQRIKSFTPAKTITPATQGTPAVLRPGYKNLLFPWKRKLREGAYAPSHGNSLNSCKKHHYRLSIQAFSIFGILTTQLNCCEAGVKKYFLIYALAYAPPPPARLTPEH